MRIKEGELLICPYEGCGKVGEADHGFKRIIGTSVFRCPECGRTFIAFVGDTGRIHYTKRSKRK